jgi:hypothetical protein
VNSSPPFSTPSVKESFNIKPVQINGPVTASLHPRHSSKAKGLLKRDKQTQVAPSTLEKRAYSTPYKDRPPNRQASLQVPFSPPSYSRKPSPFGPKMSICAKGVSTGVHNIAFLLLPDHFRAFDLFFFGTSWGAMKRGQQKRVQSLGDSKRGAERDAVGELCIVP